MGVSERPTRPTSRGEAPRYSIVMPTFQRRDVVTSAVKVLAALEYDPAEFEVIVVVDGSTDGTAQALRSLAVPFLLTTIEQPNRGASCARNSGARAARGEILLFLDDDMHAAPGLLAAHDAAYAEGADAVVGHVPLHPDSPRSLLSAGVGSWAADRARRLGETDGELTFADLLTGQLSVPRELFWSVGGFDEDFTRGGTFGREDTDFGHRLVRDGRRLVFRPDAVSFQYYVVRPRDYLRQWHQAGHADIAYVRKHPDESGVVFASRRPRSRWNRLAWRPLTRVPVVSDAVATALRTGVLVSSAARPDSDRVRRWFFRARDLEYWRGVHAAGGFPAPRPLRVVCYHSVSDLSRAPVVDQYGVPAPQLARQLRTLRRAGFRFVSLGEVLRFVEGRGGLPRRPVLVTFDDCYVDLLEQGLPVLREERVPAVAFAVTRRTGRDNDWDRVLGAPALPLLDAEGLLALAAAGVEVGAHGRTHRPLTGLRPDELVGETAGAVADLVEMGLPAPQAFSYPHGEHDVAARDAVASTGVSAAFTVTPGVIRGPVADPFRLGRIEVLRRDGAGLRLILKVYAARRMPPRARRFVETTRRRWVRRFA